MTRKNVRAHVMTGVRLADKILETALVRTPDAAYHQGARKDGVQHFGRCIATLTPDERRWLGSQLVEAANAASAQKDKAAILSLRKRVWGGA